jgi:hypothetical protein
MSFLYKRFHHGYATNGKFIWGIVIKDVHN